jgi:hypothetical protein
MINLVFVKELKNYTNSNRAENCKYNVKHNKKFKVVEEVFW